MSEKIGLPPHIIQGTKIGRSSCVIKISGDMVSCADQKTDSGCRIFGDDSTLTGCPLRNGAQPLWALVEYQQFTYNGAKNGKVAEGTSADPADSVEPEKAKNHNTAAIVTGAGLLLIAGMVLSAKLNLTTSRHASAEAPTRAPVATVEVVHEQVYITPTAIKPLPTVTPLPTVVIEPTKILAASSVKIGESGAINALGAVLRLTGQTDIKNVQFPITIKVVEPMRGSDGRLIDAETITTYNNWRELPGVVHRSETWYLVQ